MRIPQSLPGLLLAIALAPTSVLSQTHAQSPTPATQASGASLSQASVDALLPAGTSIPVELSKSIDAKKAKAGDKIEARVTMDLLAHGRIVVPRDSKLTGHVTDAKPRSKQSPESSVGIAFDHISMKDGRELPMRASVQAIGPSLKQVPFPENGNEVPGQAPPDMHAGNTPTWRGNPGTSGGSPRTNGSTYPTGNPQDVPVGTVPNESSAPAALDPQSQGVIGMKGLSLNNSEQGSSVSSSTNNVHLDGGTQLILRTQ